MYRGRAETKPCKSFLRRVLRAFELARHRQLSADELGDLAERLAASNDPAEITRLRSAEMPGFYGE